MLQVDLTLYAITPTGLPRLELAVEQALRGGVTMLQLREKSLPDADLYALACRIKRITDAYKVPLIINDRADIALSVNAAGAHLGQGDGDLLTARKLLGPKKILGATARTVEQALAAEAAGADYLGSGALFSTGTKTDALPMPREALREICGAVSLPVVAIGGITTENITQLKGCGIAGVAVAAGIFGQANIEFSARGLRDRANFILQQGET